MLNQRRARNSNIKVLPLKIVSVLYSKKYQISHRALQMILLL